MMNALKCSFVKDNHGPKEAGKDVIYTVPHFLKKDINGAIILKAVKVGQAALDNLIRQINQAIELFSVPRDPSNKLRVNELILMTSYDFTEDVRTYIFNNSGKTFPNMHFVNGDEMELLISGIMNEHYEKTQILQTFSIDAFLTICEEVTDRKLTIASSVIRPANEGTELVE